jgi:hypothetical protein
MTKKVWLDGHPFDLEDLADLLESGDTRVVREGDRFYLTSHNIDNAPQGVEYYDAAGQLITKINGLGHIYKPDFRPVTLSGECTEGGLRHFFVAALPVEIRIGMGSPTVTVTDSDGNTVPPEPSPWPARFALAASHPAVAEVLDIMGQHTALEWPHLYNVFEIIKDSVSPTKVHQLGSVTRNTVSRFTGSAQPHRHARPSGVHPNPMSLAEGRDFVSKLVTAWMTTLIP